MKRIKKTVCLVATFAALSVGSAACSMPSKASDGAYSRQQVCNGWAELQDGILTNTMTQSDITHKVGVMKSNADDAALMDSKWNDLDLAVQQLRAALANNDSSPIPDLMATINSACP